ncbi:hypothetical protein VTJ04DRAFT_119 [Mycothermus thermophilus]|uniref:uncharacterized protein n=1 Tax=Humicola insolens TaxID=85995 RepID=UPI003742751B
MHLEAEGPNSSQHYQPSVQRDCSKTRPKRSTPLQALLDVSPAQPPAQATTHNPRRQGHQFFKDLPDRSRTIFLAHTAPQAGVRP